MRRDPHRALMAALAGHFGPLDHVTARTRPWSSATFSGMRHELMFSVEPHDANRRRAATLGEADLPMPGHFVADIAVLSARTAGDRLNLVLEALSIEEA